MLRALLISCVVGVCALVGLGIVVSSRLNSPTDPQAPEKIFVSSPNIAPDVANTFVQILTAQTARLPTAPGMQAGIEADNEDASTVRTFGIPAPGESESDETEYDPNY